MGVKDLWGILSPVCERKSLWELQQKTIAVDLSGWICDSNNVAEGCSQPRMYLRNLFFRTCCLLMLGVKLVYVLDGTAPDLKLQTMSKRNAVLSGKSQTGNKPLINPKNVKRSHFRSISKKCEELLKIMGLTCVQSKGEAEALCAKLNQDKLVDGCISQDGDCFLYGAEIVFRNFTISSTGSNGASGFSVDIYKMEDIIHKLFLSRNKLIALSILCGCDYNEKGVAGIGKETALKFLERLTDDEVLDRLRSWRNNTKLERLDQEMTETGKSSACENCGHRGTKLKHSKSGCQECQTRNGCNAYCGEEPLLSQMEINDRKIIISELKMRKKALEDPSFPYEEIISEYLQQGKSRQSLHYIDSTWQQPNLLEFIKFSVKYLNWDEEYAFEKFFPLITRWQIVTLTTKTENELKDDNILQMFYPEVISKKRICKGVASYEIIWKDQVDIIDAISHDKSKFSLITFEPQEMVCIAYPWLVESFNEKLAEKAKKAKKTKPKKVKKEPEITECNDVLVQRDICNYFKPINGQKALQEDFRQLSMENKGNKTSSTKSKASKRGKENNIATMMEKFSSLDISNSFEVKEKKIKNTNVPVSSSACKSKSGLVWECFSDIKESGEINFEHGYESFDFSEDDVNVSELVDSIINRRKDNAIENIHSRKFQCQNVNEDKLTKNESFEHKNTSDSIFELPLQSHIPDDNKSLYKEHQELGYEEEDFESNNLNLFKQSSARCVNNSLNSENHEFSSGNIFSNQLVSTPNLNQDPPSLNFSLQCSHLLKTPDFFL